MSKILVSVFCSIFLFACDGPTSDKGSLNSQGNADTTTKSDTLSEPLIGSEIRVQNLHKSFILSPGVDIDFRNFAYDDFILSNGLSYSDVEMGFDTIRHIKTHDITDSLHLVELYQYYGGGSSEMLKKVYLYRRDHDALVLLTKLECSGNYPSQQINNRIKIKAEHFKGGEMPNCCPWKYEIAEFEISRDGLTFGGHTFEDIPE